MVGSYSPEKDLALKVWKNDEIGLMAAIYSYNNGQPKFQIGPRIVWKKTVSGELKSSRHKTGRLEKQDIMWLREIIDEVIDAFNDIRDVMFVEGEYKDGIQYGENRSDLTALYEAAVAQQKQLENDL